MTRFMLSLLCGIGLLLALCACATVSQPVYRVPESNDCSPSGIAGGKCTKFDGVPYVLPRTALRITIEVRKETGRESAFLSEAREICCQKHDCTRDKANSRKNKRRCGIDELKKDVCIRSVYDMADRLGIKVKETEDIRSATKYRLSQANAIAEAEPDPDQVYFVKIKGGLFERRSLDISFAPNGVPKEIGMGAENKTMEFVATTFGSMVGAVTKAGLFGRAEAQVSTKTQEDPCGGSKYRTLVHRALGALRFIEAFSNLRTNELKGVSNQAMPEATLQLRLKELDAMRDAAAAIFEPKDKSEQLSYEATWLPDRQKRVRIAQFSKACGLFSSFPPSDETFSSNIPQMDKGECEDNRIYDITAILSNIPHKPKTSLSGRIADALDDHSEPRGIYYRVPETARLRITKSYEGDMIDLLVKDIAVAQFGKVVSLPAETGSSNVTYKVTLDPVSGMMLRVAISSEAASTATAKDLVDPVGDYLKERRDSKDELALLQREEAILKARKSIKELREAVGQ